MKHTVLMLEKIRVDAPMLPDTTHRLLMTRKQNMNAAKLVYTKDLVSRIDLETLSQTEMSLDQLQLRMSISPAKSQWQHSSLDDLMLSKLSAQWWTISHLHKWDIFEPELPSLEQWYSMLTSFSFCKLSLACVLALNIPGFQLSLCCQFIPHVVALPWLSIASSWRMISTIPTY